MKERLEWIKEQFPSFVVAEAMLPFIALAERNTPLDDSDSIDDEHSWMVIPDPQILIDMKPITHPLWLEDWDFGWEEVLKDIAGGVTFAFYWKENYLAWER